MKVKRKIVEIDEGRCDGCGQCVPSCAEGAIEIVDGKARIAAEKYCDGLGACLGECPNDALTIIEREAEDFDEEAVEAHLQVKEKEESTMPCGCPSANLRTFIPPASTQDTNHAGKESRSVSSLSHWPIQIRLVPPTAPFLKGADLLVVADCVPVAYPNLNSDFLSGKAVLIGCPKLDDAEAYIEKFAEIFRTADLKSVTVLIMEVPCCFGLETIIKRAMEAAGKEIPFEEVVISTRGEILKREKMAA
ncbi:MAG: 4Fe-4S binding protein [Desulfobacteraceae bacterium]|nr:4Fe-4S binding protein [Desulfobacteraceae bacterium]